jgi:uncharacterized membrane protein
MADELNPDRSAATLSSRDRVCPDCAAEMPEAATFCPGCGRPMSVPTRARAKVGILTENIAGALAYFTFLPALVFLFLKPYSRNRFVCFHSVQCLLFCGAAILAGLALKVAALLLLFIPTVGQLFMVVVSMVMVLAAMAIWLVLVVKAAQGEMFKLILLGNFAQKQSDQL